MAKTQPFQSTLTPRRQPLLRAGALTALLMAGGCTTGNVSRPDRPATVIPIEETTMGSSATVRSRSAQSMAPTRDELVARLKRAGELEVLGGDQAEIDSYFDTSNFRFHGPDGFEADYAGLTGYFKSIRAAFDDRSIRRGIVVVEGNYIACQTWIEGRFVREFAHSPVGPLAPNGQRVVWDLMNVFRVDDQGKLVEEWVRTDNRSFLRQLGGEGR